VGPNQNATQWGRRLPSPSGDIEIREVAR
jgi:hypothetical protein